MNHFFRFYLRGALAAALLGLWSTAMAQSLIAEVDRATVVDGESVALYLVGTNLSETPDVSALYNRFDILDSRTSEQVSIIQNKRQAKNTWRFELRPKNLGQSVIPAFTVDGVSTKPIVINVKQRGAAGASPRDNIFVELSVDNAEPYVQSQVVLTVEVWDAADIASGSLTDPQSPDIQVERLADGQQRLDSRNGVEYRILTRRYALFPQRSGEITLPPVLLNANVKDKGYSGGLILRFTPTRRVSVSSQKLVFNVKSRPAESTAAWWLPVQKLSLTSQWSADISDAQVGEPLTRTVTLTAQGATSAQLPSIDLPDIPELKIYPDAPELVSEGGPLAVVSGRLEKWSVIPQRSGTMTLPAVSIKWWDTINNVEREAKLEAETLVVKAPPGSFAQNQAASPPPVQNQLQSNPQIDTQAAQQPAIANTNEAPPQNPELAENANSSTESVVVSDEAAEPVTALGAGRGLLPNRANAWMWIAIAAISGWLLTIGSWLFSRFRAKRVVTGEGRLPGTANSQSAGRSSQLLKEVQQSSISGNPVRFREALMRWAAVHWGSRPPLNPLDIGARLRSSKLRREFRELDSGIYARRPVSVDLPTIYRELTLSLEQEKNSPETDSASAHLLPQL